jgi:hypothetical protein
MIVTQINNDKTMKDYIERWIEPAEEAIPTAESMLQAKMGNASQHLTSVPGATTPTGELKVNYTNLDGMSSDKTKDDPSRLPFAARELSATAPSLVDPKEYLNHNRSSHDDAWGHAK